MTTISKALLALEEKLWTGDAEVYRRNLDNSCLLAFPGMAGVFSREDVAGTAGDGSRWKNPEIKLKGLIEPVAGVAILTYQARATRASGEAYAALVGTAYVKRDGGWKMAFHQRTPLEA